MENSGLTLVATYVDSTDTSGRFFLSLQTGMECALIIPRSGTTLITLLETETIVLALALVLTQAVPLEGR